MIQKTPAIPSYIGPYPVLESLGRGGMGEVFLVQDPSCGRNIALKQIRPGLRENKTMQNRFLREAKVASALTHPSIIPILSVQTSPPDIYYTMPFVEGETLRQILRKTYEEEKSGEPLHPIGRSISSLARIYLQICEAVAYTHSKGILHRDLKPENIIIGKYGEVMILDWGIADFLDQIEEEDVSPFSSSSSSPNLTRPGKITGTLAYLPPERIKGANASSVQTDIYALGVILYQILTLQLPFQRKSIATFRKNAHMEEWIDPLEISPSRDIPHQLAAIAKKCLASDSLKRYQNVEELIGDVKNYVDGKPEWIYLGDLALSNNEDWLLQENILLAKNIAITRSLDVTEWAALAISKRSFPENIRMDAEVSIGAEGRGIGFLLNIPECVRNSLEEGYCVWLGSQKDPSCRIFRNNVQIMETKGLYLTPGKIHHIRIEKTADHLKFYLDHLLRLELTSYLPLAGTHVGLLQRDSDFQLQKWSCYDGSHNLMMNCLSLPNAFFSHKLYDLALKEYRRIEQSFPGRPEGKEALFRAGLTLLEQGKKSGNEKMIHLALKEFEKLYRTSGAPLEYLGKSMVYEALQDYEEEAKCLELALRKFPKHPLLPMLKEHIVYRMHESSLNHRESAYRIILLALRHIPDLFENPDTCSLLDSLQKNWEPLLFIEESENVLLNMAIQLAFWLAKAPILVEIAEELLKKDPVDEILLGNAIFSLIELEQREEVKKFLNLPYPRIHSAREALQPLDEMIMPKQMKKWEYRSLHYRMQKALQNREFKILEKMHNQLLTCKLSKTHRLSFDAMQVWGYLLQKNLQAAKLLFDQYPISVVTQDTSPLYFPFGTWIHLQKGAKASAAFFNSVFDTPYPTTLVLSGHFLAGRIDEKKGWIERAFFWEKKALYRQLDLFEHTVGKKVIAC